MSNNCENSLVIEGPPEDVKKFVDKAPGWGWGEEGTPNSEPDVLSFHNFVPMPDVLIKANQADPANDEWYHWAQKNWGTKWDACESTRDGDASTGRVEYSFYTAWGPPISWVYATGKQYPMLTFTLQYAEPGGDFAGEIVVKDVPLSDDRMSYGEAQILWHGKWEVSCDECCEDIVVTMAEPEYRICDECYSKRCARCKKTKEEHQDDKCLFESTQFLSIRDDRAAKARRSEGPGAFGEVAGGGPGSKDAGRAEVLRDEAD